jgi:hypothetical protein
MEFGSVLSVMQGLYPTTRLSYMWGAKAPTARIYL